jgi:radical SAM-linked protein
MRCLERWFRRAGLPLGFSEGFHPKPRMTFPLALAVGIAADDEVMELELSQPLSAEHVVERLAPHAVPGIELRSVENLPAGAKKARVRRVAYAAAIPPSLCASLPERIEAFLSRSSAMVERAANRGPIDLRPLVQGMGLHGCVLQMQFAVADGPSAGPREALTALGLPDAELQGVRLSRTTVEIEA